MENLNLVELLRDCPTGMELDSTVFDNITFDYVNTQQNRVYCKVDKSESVWFTPKGGVNLLPNAKCVIFPKGKTTWEGFHRPFVDGDILATTGGAYVAIVKKNGGKFYCCCHANGTYFVIDESGWFDRLATEEEKAKLFKAIKENGYKWNAETKTLEKLIVPKFKVGDRIQEAKARDRKDNIYTITKIDDVRYYIEGCPYRYTLPIAIQDHYILVPNKFDITTLKPFDKVLARDCNEDKWNIDFFGYYRDNGTYQCMTFTKNQCIPYEVNKELLGTTNNPKGYGSE